MSTGAAKKAAKDPGPKPFIEYAPGWEKTIPTELWKLRQWVGFKFEVRDGKWDKPPFQIWGTREAKRHASTTDPETWDTWDRAVTAVLNRDKTKLDGAGFVFGPDDPYTGIDFDYCLGPDGRILDWAWPIINQFLPTFADISPSRRGLKLWVRAYLPGPGRKKSGLGPDGTGGIEIYDMSRYFTTTGRPLDGTPHPTIEDRTVPTLALYEEIKPAGKSDRPEGPRPKPVPLDLSDEEIVRRARGFKNYDRFGRLFDGDTSDYQGDESRADSGFCNYLRWLLRGDPVRMDRVVRSSGLFRPKWDEARGTRTYGQRTIDFVLSDWDGSYYGDDRNRPKMGGKGKAKSQAKPSANGHAGPGVAGAVGPRVYTEDEAAEANALLPEGETPVRAGDPHPEADQPGDGRPSIECQDIGLDVVTRQAMDAHAARNDPPEVFNTGGVLSWIKPTGESARPTIEPMGPDALRNRLAEVAHFRMTKETEKGPRPILIFPPRDICKAMAAQKTWPVRVAPPLDIVTEFPQFHPAGSLVTRPGYHPQARIYYQPPPGIDDLEIPDGPDPGDVAKADALIDEYVHDFPFDTPASKANAKACMLLPFVRPMIDGPTPLHFFESSTEGVGKGKLANACAFPALGRDLTSTPQKEDEAEWRKAITTELMAGSTHLFIDNMYNPRAWDGTPMPVDSASLAAVLTQPEWGDRLMGGNRKIILRIRSIFMGSGNNVEWSKELSRRVVPIRLKTPVEDPSERKDWYCKPDTLEEWARKRRRELLRACLVICRYWIVKGCPAGKQTMGSYESYARIMGGILEAATIPGFLGNRAKGTTRDRESLRWVALVQAWDQSRSSMLTSTAHLYDLIFGEKSGVERLGGNHDLQIAFADILGDGKELSQKQKLGNALRKQKDRVWAGKRIVASTAKARGATELYRLADPAEMTTEEDGEGQEHKEEMDASNGIDAL